MAQVNLDISQRLDITCRKSDTFSLDVVFKDATGAPLNLTTYTEFKMEVRRHDRKTGASTLTFTLTGSDITVNSSGNMNIEKNATTMNIASGDYVYDLQAVDGTGVHTWLKGKFIVNEDVTIS
jgi:hypothetical protein